MADQMADQMVSCSADQKAEMDVTWADQMADQMAFDLVDQKAGYWVF